MSGGYNKKIEIVLKADGDSTILKSSLVGTKIFKKKKIIRTRYAKLGACLRSDK
jgi:hypothetical protein